MPSVERSRTADAPRIHPLLVRPGVRYTCFGDGLCCTDIHLLGPVTRPEKQALDLLAPGALVRDRELGAPVFRTESGRCVLRSARGCELHATHGPEAKPAGCMRFPLGLVATPEGGRVTTQHRCPCRSLGTRPALAPESASESLRDSLGRLRADTRVGPKVRLTRGKSVSFARYRSVEQPLLASLLDEGVEPLRALGARPLTRVAGLSLGDVLDEMRSDEDGTAYGAALGWFASAFDAVRRKQPMPLRERPWAAAFDRAQQRPGRTQPQQVFADWIADQVWSLDWVFSVGDLEAARKELAMLYVAARAMAERLVRSRVRADRAAAEAVTVVELVRHSGAWEKVQQAL